MRSDHMTPPRTSSNSNSSTKKASSSTSSSNRKRKSDRSNSSRDRSKSRSDASTKRSKTKRDTADVKDKNNQPTVTPSANQPKLISSTTATLPSSTTTVSNHSKKVKPTDQSGKTILQKITRVTRVKNNQDTTTTVHSPVAQIQAVSIRLSHFSYRRTVRSKFVSSS